LAEFEGVERVAALLFPVFGVSISDFDSLAEFSSVEAMLGVPLLSLFLIEPSSRIGFSVFLIDPKSRIGFSVFLLLVLSAVAAAGFSIFFSAAAFSVFLVALSDNFSVFFEAPTSLEDLSDFLPLSVMRYSEKR
jgi:hypothetical protein